MLFLWVLLIGLVLLLGINYIYMKEDILKPPFVMTGMFVLGTVFALLNVGNWKIDYSFWAMFYILTGILAFSAPIYYAEKRIPATPVRVKSRPIDISLWKIVFAIVVDLIIILLFHLEIAAIAERAGYAGKDMQWFIRKVTSYNTTVEFSGFIKLIVRFIDITAYIFLFTFINNVLVYGSSLRKQLWQYSLKIRDKVYQLKIYQDYLLLIPVLLFIYKTSMTGGRLDIIRIIFAAVVQMYILEKSKYGWNAPIARKYIMIGLGGIAVGIPAFYYGLFLVGRSTTRTIFQTISTYLGGPIQHFNQYVQHPVVPNKYFGSETFTPLLNILGDLGIIDYSRTVHLEYRQLGVTKGNVYTFFRRPLHDFGPIGMYLFVIAIGAFFAYYYYKVIRGKKRNCHWDIQVLIYSYLFYWVMLSSIEQYSMVILSVFTLIGVILFYVLGIFYWKIEIDVKRKKIIIKNTEKKMEVE